MVDTAQPAAIGIITGFLGISTIFIALRVSARIIAWRDKESSNTYVLWSECYEGALVVLFPYTDRATGDALVFVAYVCFKTPATLQVSSNTTNTISCS